MVRSSVTLNVQRCILRVVVVTSVLVLSPGANAADPFERINRVTHAINEGVDRMLLRPAPVGYTRVLPAFVRGGLGNVGCWMRGVHRIRLFYLSCIVEFELEQPLAPTKCRLL